MKKKLIILLVLLCSSIPVFSQENDAEISEEEWEFIRDQYAVNIIKLLVALENLNAEADSLKGISESLKIKNEKLEDEMYAIAGITKNGVSDFRKKFEETEKKISGRTGTPSEARQTYYDEISVSKAVCLPEFAERFISMKRQMAEWEGRKPPPVVVLTEGTYTVVKGDCLWKIASEKLGSPRFWPAIWDANKDRIVNSDYFYETKHRSLTDPEFIYPGQVLRIPSLNEEVKRKYLEQ